MFEKVLVKPKGLLNNQQSLVDLIDLLLYYEEVHIIINPENFVGFYNAFSEDLVEELIKSRRIILHPTESQLACNTTNDGYYGITFISHGWDDIHHLLYEFYNRLIIDDVIKSRQFANRFSSIVDTFTYSNEIGCGIYDDLLDTNYMEKAFDVFMRLHFPTYHRRSNVKIEIELLDISLFPNAFKVRHNYDELYSSSKDDVNKPHLELYPFLLSISDSKITSYLATQYGSEITTTYENAEYIMLQLNDLIKKSICSQENLDAFQKHILQSSLSIGEAFVEKKINEKELIKTLKKAEKFRDWLNKLPNDASLIGEYVNEINKKTIMDNTWIKIGREIMYSLISFCGGTGPFIGTGLSILDSLYADKLVSGWKPNLFVEDLKNKLNTYKQRL